MKNITFYNKVDDIGIAFKKGIHVDFHQCICFCPPKADRKLMEINSSASGGLRQKLIEAIYRQNPNHIFYRTIMIFNSNE